MRITFLGTGTSQGVPVIGCECAVCISEDPRDNRLRTSAMVDVDGKTIVIDTGPDFRQQMLRARPYDIDAVIFTHEHKDHIAGLDDIRPFNYKHNKALDIYATYRVQEALKREFHYVFSEHTYPGIPEVKMHDIDPERPFLVQGIEIIPILVYHYKMPVLGFRIGNFAYITDANHIPEQALAQLRGLDALVVNALRRQVHISHFNLDQAVELALQIKPKNTYFTHISHLMGLHEVVSQELPDKVFLAYDMLSIEI